MDKYYDTSPEADPDSRPAEALARTIRGNAWNLASWGCRPASRFRYGAGGRNFLGFRGAAGQE